LQWWGMALSQKLKELRVERNWTQQELARRAGVSRQSISYYEQQDRERPTADILLSVARAFNIKPEELYQAAGYIKGDKGTSLRSETPEEILDRLKLATPVSIPVYTDYPFHAGDPVEPVDFVYRARPKLANKNIEGYIVHGKCLEPDINNGDIIIVDREGEINNGDIIACLLDNEIHIARLRKIADELWLESNDGRRKFEECQVAAPVIECIRRLK